MTGTLEIVLMLLFLPVHFPPPSGHELYSFYKSGAQPPARCHRRVQVESASISITSVFSSPSWSSNITLSRHHAYLTIIVLSSPSYCSCHHCFSSGSLLLLEFSSPCSKNKMYLFDSNLFSMSTPAITLRLLASVVCAWMYAKALDTILCKFSRQLVSPLPWALSTATASFVRVATLANDY